MLEAVMDAIDPLKLENQLCFPLYAAAKEVVRLYAPLLKEIDLTYTQYIAMMVLWQERELTVKALGQRLLLDAGTLSPMLKKMAERGLVTRRRDPDDERSVVLTVTAEGMALKSRAVAIPPKIGSCIPLTQEEARLLYGLLYKILDNLKEDAHDCL
jgi:DNA-binding MarR family transcriptional regulator